MDATARFGFKRSRQEGSLTSSCDICQPCPGEKEPCCYVQMNQDVNKDMDILFFCSRYCFYICSVGPLSLFPYAISANHVLGKSSCCFIQMKIDVKRVSFPWFEAELIPHASFALCVFVSSSFAWRRLGMPAFLFVLLYIFLLQVQFGIPVPFNTLLLNWHCVSVCYFSLSASQKWHRNLHWCWSSYVSLHEIYNDMIY